MTLISSVITSGSSFSVHLTHPSTSLSWWVCSCLFRVYNINTTQQELECTTTYLMLDIILSHTNNEILRILPQIRAIFLVVTRIFRYGLKNKLTCLKLWLGPQQNIMAVTWYNKVKRWYFTMALYNTK